MDRNLYKSDKKLAQQGWRSMRRALDREMPERRRRRPVVLLWILGLLLPTAGVLAWLLFQPGTTPPGTDKKHLPVAAAPAIHPGAPGLAAAPTSASEPPAANAQGAVSNASASSQTAKASIGPNHHPVAQLFPASTPGHPGLTPAAATHNPPLTTTASASGAPTAHTTVVNPVNITESSTAPPTHEDNSLASGHSVATAADSSSPAPLSANTQAPRADLTQPDPATLPTTANQAPAIETPATAAGIAATTPPLPATATSLSPTASNLPITILPPTKPLHDRKNPKWSVGASSGVISDASTFAGATAGLTAAWQPADHWGVRGGLAYQYQQPAASDRPIVSITTESYATATGDYKVYTGTGTVVAPAAEATAPVYVPVTRVHRVEVPLLAYYQPFSHWRVFGGVSVGTTLRAVAGDKSLKRTTVYTVQSGTANQNLNAEISSEVRKWDTRWGTGIGFLPGRHIELDLYYFHAFAASGNQKLYASPYLDTGNSLVNSISNLTTQPVAANSMFQLAATWFF